MPNLATDLARVMELVAELEVTYHTRPIGEFWRLREEAASQCLSFLRQHGPEIAETFKETPNG